MLLRQRFRRDFPGNTGVGRADANHCPALRVLSGTVLGPAFRTAPFPGRGRTIRGDQQNVGKKITLRSGVLHQISTLPEFSVVRIATSGEGTKCSSLKTIVSRLTLGGPHLRACGGLRVCGCQAAQASDIAEAGRPKTHPLHLPPLRAQVSYAE